MIKKKNRVTELFGIEYPVLSASMSWVTSAELVAAVSNAGGLGILGANAGQTELTSDPVETAERMRAEIRKTRTLTDKPFGATLMVFGQAGPFDEPLFNRGMTRLMWGMFQKLVVANSLGVSVNYYFANIQTEAPVRLLCAAVFYSLQLYFDFAGYSDIVLGAAAMFGLQLPENFVRPYLAVDIQDFWRRWHISLSTWLQKYVYIPLGGSRKGVLRTYINLILVFLVSGLWHGAAWNFVFWGLLHGIASAAHRIVKPLWAKLGAAGLTQRNALAKNAARFGVFLFTTVAWIFFRAPSLSLSVDYLWRLGSLGEVPFYLLSTLNIPAGKLWSTYIGAALILLRDLLAENGHDPLEAVQSKPLLRTALNMALYAAIAFFGVFGVSSFLYHAF